MQDRNEDNEDAVGMTLTAMLSRLRVWTSFGRAAVIRDGGQALNITVLI